MKIVLPLQTSWKGLKLSQGNLDHTLRITVLEFQGWQGAFNICQHFSDFSTQVPMKREKESHNLGGLDEAVQHKQAIPLNFVILY